ncbi:MAG: HAD family hydrolase, partial [Desulfobacteraceae bacterium]
SAELAAAKEFQFLYKNIFPVSSDDFALNWRVITEKHVQRYLKGELTFQGQRRERLKELFSHYSILSDEEADKIFQKYLACYEKNWSLYPDVLPTLEQLVERKFGIISNGDSCQQKQKLTRTGIIDRFSVLVISGDIGVSKPDHRIFRKACRMAGFEPSECWHIGDNLEADVKGSLAAGINGIWLNRSFKNSIQGIKAIQSLLELKDIIGVYNI